MKTIAPSAIGIGIVLLLASVLWPTLFPATRTWTDEKSRRLKELSGKAQYAIGKLESAKQSPNMSGGESPAELKKKADEMMEEIKVLKAEFTSATDGPKTTSSVLKWSGVSVMLLGVVGYLATKDA